MMSGTANLTEEGLRKYLTLFHETYLESVERFVLPEFRRTLPRYLFLPTRIVGYVSTNFGAAFEYVDGDPVVEVRRSSARIEDFVTGAPARVRRLGVAFALENSHDIVVQNVKVRNLYPFRLFDSESDLKLIDLRAEALGWARHIKYAEIYGNRTATYWAAENAIARAKDEVLVAMVAIHEAVRRGIDVSHYLSGFKEKTVLILGDYSLNGMKRLRQIRVALANLGYEPLLLNEVPDDLQYDLQQKAVAIGSVVRFVVVDDSSASGHLVEFPHVQQNRWVTIILRLEGTKSSFMTKGASLYSRVLAEYQYSENNLEDVLKGATSWAEAQIDATAAGLQEEYPWRADSSSD